MYLKVPKLFHVCVVLVLMLSVSFMVPAPASAHKVSIFAYTSNGTIFTESYFPDGTPVSDGKIEIYDGRSHKLLEGKTDKEGKYSAPIPVKDDLTIVIDASMGHKNSFVLKKDDLGE